MLELFEKVGPWWIIIPVGLGVAGAVFLILRGLGQSEPPPGPLVFEVEKDEQAERRANPRRRTTPVLVDLIDPEGGRPRMTAVVQDYSTGGLALLCQEEIATESAWMVIPRAQTSTVKVGLPVEVRACTRQDDGFLINCQFRRTVSYNELLNFG